MMKTLWWWLEKNSAQLQGLAAVAGILGALAAAPYFAAKWLEPDLTVTVTSEEATTSPVLKEWLQDTASALARLPDPSGEQDPYQSLRKLQSTGPLEPSRFGTFHADEMARIKVEVTNQTNRVIPGIRLRFDTAWPVWGVTIVSTFLTASEIARWQKSISPAPELSGPNLVLPELPPLPPNSTVSLVAHGDVANADVSVVIPGASFKLVRTVRVEDKFPISAILRPYWLPLLLQPIFLLLILLLWVFARYIWRRAARIIPYNLACREAKAGRQESALSLLGVAVAAGYNNLQHMRTDPDLASLMELDSFNNMCNPSD